MTKYKYSYQGNEEEMAKVVLKDLPISSKHAIEICARLKNNTVEFAKKYLEEVIKGKKAVIFTRFTEGAGHKPGIGSGKFPEKASSEILKALKLAEAVALNKGLGTDLKIVHIIAQRASAPWHYGRQRRRKMKRTTVEIVVSEFKKVQPKKSKQTKQNPKKDFPQEKSAKKSDKKTVSQKSSVNSKKSTSEKKTVVENKKVKEDKK